MKCAVMLASLNIQDQVADLSPKVTSSALPGPGGATTAATNNISKAYSTKFSYSCLYSIYDCFLDHQWNLKVPPFYKRIFLTAKFIFYNSVV